MHRPAHGPHWAAGAGRPGEEEAMACESSPAKRRHDAAFFLSSPHSVAVFILQTSSKSPTSPASRRGPSTPSRPTSSTPQKSASCGGGECSQRRQREIFPQPFALSLQAQDNLTPSLPFPPPLPPTPTPFLPAPNPAHQKARSAPPSALCAPATWRMSPTFAPSNASLTGRRGCAASC